MRMAAQDCAYARNEDGRVAVVQFVWRYDRAVDLSGLRAFHDRLCRGRLGRVLAPATIGAAGDRWSGRARFAPLRVEPAVLARADLADWFDARAGDEVRSYGGPAWRLATVALDDGGGAVSLVAAHSLADGHTLCAAVREAVTDTAPAWTYPDDALSGPRLLVHEAAAALRQYGRTPRLLVDLVAVARWYARRAEPSRAAATPPDPFPAEPDLCRVSVSVPAQRWRDAAAARGGTPTTLAVAITAELADRLGRVLPDGLVRMQLPASVRAPGDEWSANAIALIEFDVDAKAGFGNDLSGLRAAMKQAYRSHGEVTDRIRRLYELYLLMPRRLLLWNVRRPKRGPRDVTTECSVLGAGDPALRNPDGGPAATLGCGLWQQCEADPAHPARRDGVLRAVLIELDGLHTFRVTASLPTAPDARAGLRALLTELYDGYGLTAELW